MALVGLTLAASALGACSSGSAVTNTASDAPSNAPTVPATSSAQPRHHRPHVAPSPTTATTTARPGQVGSSPTAEPTAVDVQPPSPIQTVTSTPTCSAKRLTLSVIGVRSIPDRFATDLALTNGGNSSCQVSGWVGVVLRGDASQIPCTEPGQRNCPRPVDTDTVDRPATVRAGGTTSAFILDPGEYVPFSLVWEGTLCDQAAYRAEIALPGDGHTLGVVFPEGTNPCVRPFPDDANAPVHPTPIEVTPLGMRADHA